MFKYLKRCMGGNVGKETFNVETYKKIAWLRSLSFEEVYEMVGILYKRVGFTTYRRNYVDKLYDKPKAWQWVHLSLRC